MTALGCNARVVKSTMLGTRHPRPRRRSITGRNGRHQARRIRHRMRGTATVIPLTHHRTLVCDVADLARRVPLFPVERTMNLARVAAAREAACPRIAWSVLFLKAYARVAVRRPEL